MWFRLLDTGEVESFMSIHILSLFSYLDTICMQLHGLSAQLYLKLLTVHHYK